MILNPEQPKIKALKQTNYKVTHRQLLAKCRLSGRVQCGGRSVSSYHFFKHSRGFLWFILCNLLLNANSDAQLLINVQNQVRFCCKIQ